MRKTIYRPIYIVKSVSHAFSYGLISSKPVFKKYNYDKFFDSLEKQQLYINFIFNLINFKNNLK